MSHRHWRELAVIANEQKIATRLCLAGKVLPEPPLVVTFTRIGPRALDDDNLVAACKYVRDQISYAVAIDDRSDQYTWQYKQRTGPRGYYAVEVEIVSR